MLLGEDAFAFQQLYQRRGLPHVGDGDLFEVDEGVRVKGLSHDATARVEAVQVRRGVRTRPA